MFATTFRTVLAVIVAAVACAAVAPEATAAPDKLKASMGISVADKDCTLGFILADRQTGTANALTAGHCARVGTKVTTTDGQTIGTVAELAPGDIDVARVAIHTELTVYSDVDQIGPVTDTISVEDLNQTRPLVCKKGARTGLSCGPLVGQATATWFAFAADADHGDSGSPVYVLSRTGKLLAAGILEGSETANPGTAVAIPIVPFLNAWHLKVAR